MDLDIEARQMGHRSECDLCGEMVDYKRTIPNGQEELYYQHCWADAYSAPERFIDYNRTIRIMSVQAALP